jgi:predicted phosphodiesterase
MEIELLNYSNIIVVGDIHGNFRELIYKIKSYKIKNTVICLAGDIGVGFNKPNYYITELKRLNGVVKKTNNYIFAVRGNHDDPEYFGGNKNIEFSNVKLVPDYFLLKTKCSNILFIGGSVSIDRTNRIENVSWWRNETPIYCEKHLENINKIDVIVTHSSPSFVWPVNKDGIRWWLLNDSKLEDDCTAERLVFDQIWEYVVKNKIKPKIWAYGHYHSTMRTQHENTIFRCVDCLEFFEIRNN